MAGRSLVVSGSSPATFHPMASPHSRLRSPDHTLRLPTNHPTATRRLEDLSRRKAADAARSCGAAALSFAPGAVPRAGAHALFAAWVAARALGREVLAAPLCACLPGGGAVEDARIAKWVPGDGGGGGRGRWGRREGGQGELCMQGGRGGGLLRTGSAEKARGCMNVTQFKQHACASSIPLPLQPPIARSMAVRHCSPLQPPPWVLIWLRLLLGWI